ncbi:alpha-(1,3)-fucosyltransferase C-like isoform X1 [Penaeus indicus]|uniref:alpha-(1,3)-fucosyltransferase C-like isoform X1 n=1 Tax=Penaeus indicus TaxID=29960 RepID=UPI00300D45B8
MQSGRVSCTRTMRLGIGIAAALTIVIPLLYQAIPTEHKPVSLLHDDDFLRMKGRMSRTPDWTAFRDRTFEPLLEAFRKVANNSTGPTPAFRSGAIPKFLLWSEPFDANFWMAQTDDVRKGRCPLPCNVTFDKKEVKSADAVLIYIRSLPKRPLQLPELEPRDPRQPWIALSFEAPPRANKYFYDDFHLLNGAFNRTMLYRRDADVVVPHGFVVGRGEEADLLPEIWHSPPISRVPSRERKMAVTFISNCQAESGRLEYIHKVQEYISVDIYGRCGPLKCGHSMYVQHRYNPVKDKCLMNAGMNYLFYFAFENSLCNEYVTEKLYNILFYPIVPVVLGAANYSTLLPPNSFIDAREFSPIQLASLLRRLSQSPEEYQKYHEWRQHYHVSLWGGQRSLCHLCVRLHDPAFYSTHVIRDFQGWFVNESRCGWN